MIKIRLRKLSRRHICSVAGCRCRDTYLVQSRDDVNGSPLYLCGRCIEDIARCYEVIKADEEKAKKQVESEIEALTKAAVGEKFKTLTEQYNEVTGDDVSEEKVAEIIENHYVGEEDFSEDDNKEVMELKPVETKPATAKKKTTASKK